MGRTDTAIQGILFDKDGTLFDFHETWRPIMRKAALFAAAGNERLAAEMLHAGGYDAASGRFLPDSVIAAGHAGELAELWLQHGASVPLPELKNGLDTLFRCEAETSSAPVPGLRTLLRDLSLSGLVLGIATNDSEAAAQAAARQFGLERYVSFVAGYDSGYGAKPGPGMALAFCDAAGLAPGAVAVVGDSAHDMAMARAAGAGLCIGVLTGAGTRETLAGYADMVLEDISGLAEHFLFRTPLS